MFYSIFVTWYICNYDQNVVGTHMHWQAQAFIILKRNSLLIKVFGVK